MTKEQLADIFAKTSKNYSYPSFFNPHSIAFSVCPKEELLFDFVTKKLHLIGPRNKSMPPPPVFGNGTFTKSLVFRSSSESIRATIVKEELPFPIVALSMAAENPNKNNIRISISEDAVYWAPLTFFQQSDALLSEEISWFQNRNKPIYHFYLLLESNNSFVDEVEFLLKETFYFAPRALQVLTHGENSFTVISNPQGELNDAFPLELIIEWFEYKENMPF